MTSPSDLINTLPFSLDHTAKSALLTEILVDLTRHHYLHSNAYRKLLDALHIDPDRITDYHQIPFLPVRLFKEYDLISVDHDQVVKTLTSSGTTGQQVSKIYLDSETSALQTKALAKIVGSFIGSSRLPMIVIDSSAVVENRTMFSARGAGVIGFSIFGRDKVYALDDSMNLDIETLQAFLKKHLGQKILLFGFTYMIWEHFLGQLRRAGYQPDLSQGILIHGGGWKKLADRAVAPAAFKAAMYEACGIERVYNYYGMVEQTGSIYVECEQGHLHASIFSDVIIRRPSDFAPAGVGDKGIIQVVSVLPKSYPGHSLLTEDEGTLLGEDNCSCGRLGKYFAIAGRIKNAELRGCSDTYVKQAA